MCEDHGKEPSLPLLELVAQRTWKRCHVVETKRCICDSSSLVIDIWMEELSVVEESIRIGNVGGFYECFGSETLPFW